MGDLFTKSGAHFSPCRTYRYALWREWDDALPPVAFIGLNPSTADETADDPTIKKCLAFAREWDRGSLIMLNLFAYRATDPDDMKRAQNPVGPSNDDVIQMIAGMMKDIILIAAWGNDGIHLGRAAAVCTLPMYGYDNRTIGDVLKCIRVNHTGQPAHPLYLPGRLMPIDFRMPV
ncbi:MAG: DUF1643 domain-containing protein [Planctomycetes bacterium]|nr:DUF1643 domain-containing protein [Planctomycetota bacterium]